MRNLAERGWPWYSLWEDYVDGECITTAFDLFWAFAAGEIDLQEFEEVPYLKEYRLSIMRILASMTEEKREDWLVQMSGHTAFRMAAKEEGK